MAACHHEDMSGELTSLYDEFLNEHDNIAPDADELYDIFINLIDTWGCRSELPTLLCPLCQLKYVANNDVLRYLLQRMNRTYTSVCEGIRKTHGENPAVFYQSIKDIKLNVV